MRRIIMRPIKAAGKPILRRLWFYLQQIEEEMGQEAQRKGSETHNYDQDMDVYPWLNSIFLKIVNDGFCAQRPNYTWGVLHGVYLARTIGIKRVSVIEFGVAGGNGLISLERIAEKVEEIFGVGIDVYGFDVGTGIPRPQDYRDLPNLFVEGAFLMDEKELRKRLKRTQLILGLVEETVPKFVDSGPAPVAFISIDLDYYSSTMHGLKLLEANQSLLLPRIHCYFDDMTGYTFSEYTGERLAISEFNNSHEMRKISQIYGLKYFLPAPYFHSQVFWPEQFYMAHIFDHDLYGRSDGLVKNVTGSWSKLKTN
jgi:hypothetical protein